MNQHSLPNVLLIDDQEVILDVLSKVLTSIGCTVQTASGGREGTEKFDTEQFDIVITDIDMPDLDGNEVADHIHSSGRSSRIIAISGVPSRAHENGGFDVILGKPFGVDELRDAVFKCVGSTPNPVS